VPSRKPLHRRPYPATVPSRAPDGLGTPLVFASRHPAGPPVAPVPLRGQGRARLWRRPGQTGNQGLSHERLHVCTNFLAGPRPPKLGDSRGPGSATFAHATSHLTQQVKFEGIKGSGHPRTGYPQPRNPLARRRPARQAASRRRVPPPGGAQPVGAGSGQDSSGRGRAAGVGRTRTGRGGT
jgi:hypothetical protein